MRHRLRTAGANAPLVHHQRCGHVDLGLVRFEVHFLQLGRVFDRETAGRDEIAERVVARRVPPRTPLDVGALHFQPVRTAHHPVHAGHVIGDMVQARRPRQQRDAVMRRIAAQEAHEITQPVGNLEAQHIAEPLNHRLMVGRVEHDVADLHRQAVPMADRPRGTARDIAGDFKLHPVRGEAAEAIAAARRGQVARLMHDPRTRCAHLFAQRVHIGAAVRRQRDHIDPAFIGLPQPHDVMFVMPRRLKPDHAIVRGNQFQPPRFLIEPLLCRKIDNPISDVTDFGNSAHPHSFYSQLGCATAANMSAAA